MIIFTIFVSINIGTYIFTQHKAKIKAKQFQLMNQSQTEALENALYYAYSSFFTLDKTDLYAKLLHLGITRESLRDDQVFLFIPKNPCDVCLNTQITLLEKEYIDDDHTLTLFSPHYLRKNILAKFGENIGKISFIGYDPDQFTMNSDGHVDDTIILFHTFNNDIDKFYAVNKTFGKATEIFLSSLKQSL